MKIWSNYYATFNSYQQLLSPMYLVQMSFWSRTLLALECVCVVIGAHPFLFPFQTSSPVACWISQFNNRMLLNNMQNEIIRDNKGFVSAAAACTITSFTVAVSQHSLPYTVT